MPKKLTPTPEPELTDALPTMPVGTQPGLLASVIDCTNPMPNAPFGGPVWCLWHDWSPEQRRHFIDVIDREVPDLAAMIYEYSDPVWSQREGQNR